MGIYFVNLLTITPELEDILNIVIYSLMGVTLVFAIVFTILFLCLFKAQKKARGVSPKKEVIEVKHQVVHKKKVIEVVEPTPVKEEEKPKPKVKDVTPATFRYREKLKKSLEPLLKDEIQKAIKEVEDKKNEVEIIPLIYDGKKYNSFEEVKPLLQSNQQDNWADDPKQYYMK